MRRVIVITFIVVLAVMIGKVEAQTALAVDGEVRALIAGGKLDSAMSVVNRALLTNSVDVDLLTTLSAVQKAKGQFKARRQTLERIIRVRPRAIDAHLEIARDLFESRQLDSAAQYAYAALAKSNRRSVDAFYWVGRIHGDAGRPDSALVYYRWAWSLLPTGEIF